MSAVTDRDEQQTPRTGEELARRRRLRNWAVLAALIGFVVLVYFVALTKMGGL